MLAIIYIRSWTGGSWTGLIRIMTKARRVCLQVHLGVGVGVGYNRVSGSMAVRVRVRARARARVRVSMADSSAIERVIKPALKVLLI